MIGNNIAEFFQLHARPLAPLTHISDAPLRPLTYVTPPRDDERPARYHLTESPTRISQFRASYYANYFTGQKRRRRRPRTINACPS